MTILDYHERSKHHPERYAPGPGYLDWANQPNPFREFNGTPRIELPLVADRLTARYNDLRAGVLPAAAPFDLDHIASLLELSLALSAWKAFRGSRWALRCNPSSGNLHPTEGYVVVPSMPGIAAGVYHYVSRDHALERRAEVSVAEWDEAFSGAGFFVVLTSIHWREAWKYGLRAFRYCQHDCGHAVAALSFAAGALGWTARVVRRISDTELAELSGVARSADFAHAEPEVPDALLRIGSAEAAFDYTTLLPLVRAASWRGQANRLSRSHVKWSGIDEAHSQAQKFRPSRDDAWQPPHRPSVLAPALDLSAQRIFRQRRSAVDFDGATAIEAGAFFAMLDATQPRAGVVPWEAWPFAPRVHLALFVHRVSGLEPGLYCLVRDESMLDDLREAMRNEWIWERVGPAHLPLYLLLPYDLREVAKRISCHQDIAADSCFSLGMLASFAGVQTEPWLYRELYWECGVIGQSLYLEAEAAGIRATGIGCFFDDEMHRILGLSGMNWQSLYHFTVGGPVEDARLMTLAPYPVRR